MDDAEKGDTKEMGGGSIYQGVQHNRNYPTHVYNEHRAHILVLCC